MWSMLTTICVVSIVSFVLVGGHATVQNRNLVPVIIWGPADVINRIKNAPALMRNQTEHFLSILRQMDRVDKVLVYVRNKLTPSDYRNGLNSLNLPEMLRDGSHSVKVLPFVDNPIEHIQRWRRQRRQTEATGVQPESDDETNIHEGDTVERFPAAADTIERAVEAENSASGEASDTIIVSDDAIQTEEVERFWHNFDSLHGHQNMIVLTGRTGDDDPVTYSVDCKENSERIPDLLQSGETCISMNNLLIMSYTRIESLDIQSESQRSSSEIIRPLDVVIRSMSSVHMRIHMRMPEGFDLEYIIKVSATHWHLSLIRYNGMIAVPSEEVWSLLRTSYSCHGPIVFLHEKTRKPLFRAYGLRLQPDFMDEKGMRLDDEPNNDCQHFVTIGICMVLMVVGICLLILAFGILMMMDISTCNRPFDLVPPLNT